MTTLILRLLRILYFFRRSNGYSGHQVGKHAADMLWNEEMPFLLLLYFGRNKANGGATAAYRSCAGILTMEVILH